MSRVCGTSHSPRSAASARTAAKNSRGSAVTNRGHTYLAFQSRWIAVTQRLGMTWSAPTGSSTFRVAATGASSRNWPSASCSAAARSAARWVPQPAP